MMCRLSSVAMTSLTVSLFKRVISAIDLCPGLHLRCPFILRIRWPSTRYSAGESPRSSMARRKNSSLSLTMFLAPGFREGVADAPGGGADFPGDCLLGWEAGTVLACELAEAGVGQLGPVADLLAAQQPVRDEAAHKHPMRDDPPLHGGLSADREPVGHRRHGLLLGAAGFEILAGGRGDPNR